MSVIKTPTKVSTVPTIVPISAALFKPPPLVDVGAVEPVADEDCVDDAVPVSEGRVAVCEGITSPELVTTVTLG